MMEPFESQILQNCEVKTDLEFYDEFVPVDKVHDLVDAFLVNFVSWVVDG